jgi:hypothetical protein
MQNSKQLNPNLNLKEKLRLDGEAKARTRRMNGEEANLGLSRYEILTLRVVGPDV